ncbi:hypothetical protein [Lysinibacillus sphaericus]|uniref:Phage protein n=1 Tax=Lysinibacillus sphaericus OT4b.31 TaxID=1285586 RepID=R7ZCA8_LYSSH|nr:hypothetical protein [Lysinibacillus sphaericus]EON71790.1 hypothetical protein H131_14943 [Lysinibacillus sphaericus OT4b.31]
MKNATVTINYESFQSIKDKADRYDKLNRENEQISAEQDKFVELICKCLDNANEQKASENKQYFIAKGIQAICNRYDMDLEIEYGELDEGKGKAPGKKNSP